MLKLSKIAKNFLKQCDLNIRSYKEYLQELYFSLKYMPYLEKLSDEKKKVNEEIKIIKDFQFPFYQYPELNHYFLQYLISTKEPRDAAFNKSNLMIVLGPENIGKTWFIKYNLKSLDTMDMKIKPIVLFYEIIKNFCFMKEYILGFKM